MRSLPALTRRLAAIGAIVSGLAGLVVGVPVRSEAAGTLAPASLSDVANAIAATRNPQVGAYTLMEQSSVFRALSRHRAAMLYLDNGDKDPRGQVRADNIRTLELARAAGFQARLARIPFHIKAAVVASAVYLCDRNWAKRSAIIVDRDPADIQAVANAMGNAAGAAIDVDPSTPRLALTKATALARELALISRGSEPLLFSTESFSSGTPLFDALIRRARGSRYMVANAEYSSEERVRDAVDQLRRAGADVRISVDDEKIVVSSNGDYVGSANASAGVPNQVEWGITTTDSSIDTSLRNRFDAAWQRASSDGRSDSSYGAGAYHSARHYHRSYNPIDSLLRYGHL